MDKVRCCRICGCSDNDGCCVGASTKPMPAGLCHWVEDDLCSACAPLAAVEAEIQMKTIPADVAYRLGLACGEFRKMLGGREQ